MQAELMRHNLKSAQSGKKYSGVRPIEQKAFKTQSGFNTSMGMFHNMPKMIPVKQINVKKSIKKFRGSAD